MSYVRRISTTVTTAADGSATAYLPASMSVINGLLDRILYTKIDFADGVDFTITLEATGEGIWTQENVNASAAVAPRQATHDAAGAAALYAGAGQAVRDRIAVGNDRLKIVIAAGGVAKTGTFTAVFV